MKPRTLHKNIVCVLVKTKEALERASIKNVYCIVSWFVNPVNMACKKYSPIPDKQTGMFSSIVIIYSRRDLIPHAFSISVYFLFFALVHVKQSLVLRTLPFLFFPLLLQRRFHFLVILEVLLSAERSCFSRL